MIATEIWLWIANAWRLWIFWQKKVLKLKIGPAQFFGLLKGKNRLFFGSFGGLKSWQYLLDTKYTFNNQSYLHSAFSDENWTKKKCSFVRKMFLQAWNLLESDASFSDCQIENLFLADWENSHSNCNFYFDSKLRQFECHSI